MNADGRRRFRINFPQKAIDRVAEVLDASLEEYGPDACWPWPGTRERSGYGSLTVWLPDRARRKRKYPAHRLAWVAAGFLFPNGDLTIDHTCHNPPCVNWRHLRLLSLEENSHDAFEYRSAQLAARTHCYEGHEFTPENTRQVTLRSGRPGRACLTCERDRHEKANVTRGRAMAERLGDSYD